MSLARFCRKPVVTALANDPVEDVARKMRDRHVGAVVVVDETLRPVGIVTDRDLVCRVMAEGRQAVAVREAMSTGVELLRVEEAIDSALFRMRDRGVRRMPIVNGRGQLAGLVSIDDLLVMLSSELGKTADAVRDNRGP
jgi:CBS domain-containing protein